MTAWTGIRKRLRPPQHDRPRAETVSALTRGDRTQVDLGVLDKVTGGLEVFTAQAVTFEELLTHEAEVEFPYSVLDAARERNGCFEREESDASRRLTSRHKYGVKR